MFILAIFSRISNVNARRTRKAIEAETSRKEIVRVGTSIQQCKTRTSRCREYSRPSKDNVSIYCKDKQCESSYPQFSRIILAIRLIPLFIIYNPYILITVIYIDMIFADELIYINMIQINSIIENIQRFNNIGVV